MEPDKSATLSGLYGLLKAVFLPIVIVACCVVSTLAFSFTSPWVGGVVLFVTGALLFIANSLATAHVQKSLLVGVAVSAIPWCLALSSERLVVESGLPWLLAIVGVFGAITSAWMLGKTRVGDSQWKTEIVSGITLVGTLVLGLVLLAKLQIPFEGMSAKALRHLEFAVSLSCVAGIVAYTIRWPVANATRPDIRALFGFVSVLLYATVSTAISLAAFFSYANADLAACKKELFASDDSAFLKSAAATVLSNSGREPSDSKQSSVIDTSTENEVAKGILPFDHFSLPSSKRQTTIPLTITNFFGMASHGRSTWKQIADLPRLSIPLDSVQNNATVILQQAHSFAYESTDIPNRESNAAQENDVDPPEKQSKDDLLQALLKSKDGRVALQRIGKFLTADDAPNAYWTKYLHTTVRGPIQFLTLVVFWASVLPAASFILVLLRDGRNIDWLQRDLVIFHRTDKIKHASSTVVSNGRSESLDFPNFALRVEDASVDQKALASFMPSSSHASSTAGVELPLPHQPPSDQDLRVEPANDESFTLQLLVQGEIATIATIAAPLDGARRRISGVERDGDASISLLIASGLGWASEWLKPRFELKTADEEATCEFSVNVNDATHTLIEFRIWPSHDGLASSLSWSQGARDAITAELEEQVMKDVRGVFNLERNGSSPAGSVVSVIGTQIDQQEFALTVDWQIKERPVSITLSGVAPILHNDPYVDFSNTAVEADGLTKEVLKCLDLDETPYIVEHVSLSIERSKESFYAKVDLQIPFAGGESISFPVASLCVRNAPRNGKIAVDVAVSDVADGPRKFVDFCDSLAQNNTCPFGLRAQARSNAQSPTVSWVELSPSDSQPVIEIRGISTPRSANDPPQFERLKPTSISTPAFGAFMLSKFGIPGATLNARTDNSHKEDLLVELISHEKKKSPVTIARFTFRLSPFFDVYDNQLHAMLQDTFDSIRVQSPNANLEEQQTCALVARVLKGGCTMGTRDAMYGVLEQGCNELEERTDSRMELVRYGAWLAPSFGFIGTIYGIGSALLGSEKMVTADEANQGAEISAVSQTLGSAFDTTMVALILSMLLVFLIHVSSYLTSNLIIAFRRFSNEKIIERFEGIRELPNRGP
ncbi:MotA/TolQ/ExbB proton channel family protein [Rhodopirellula sallentina]|uniref:Putative membrane protein n=1 Tax=Rhodopirellula sallentina SM41 TaxID=1263870 RepID=M5U1I4_9BACT|nr:MotA/TolQ/ExbB proton channel family protein [Rhodopirellula sallentina]EMI55317.1 putative membrane protein [Rhodopirellula sallentina SM41]